MNTLLNERLSSLLAAHLGQDHLHIPLLNRLQQWVDALAETTLAQQRLAAGAPVPDASRRQTQTTLHTQVTGYWNELSPGTVLSRLQHAVALRADDLLHRAQLLMALGEVTPAGCELLMEALEPLEGATLAVCSDLTLQAGDGTECVVPGAELIERPAGGRCLLILPGVGQQLFEFDSATEAGRGLIEYLLSAQGKELWRNLAELLPVDWRALPFAGKGASVRFDPHLGPVLKHALTAFIASQTAILGNTQVQADVHAPKQQSARFWCSLPEAIVSVIGTAVAAQGTRQQALLTFGGIAPHIASALIEQKLTECEHSIQGYIGDDLDSYPHKRYRQVHAAWQAACGKTRQRVNVLNEQRLALDTAFWSQDSGQGLTHQDLLALELGNALRHDAQLQVYEGTLKTEDLARVLQVVDQPDARLRNDEQTTVAELAVGDAAYAYTLPGAFIIAPGNAWKNSDEAMPALLYLAGEDGGLRRFECLQDLLQCVTESLREPSFTPLWARYPADAQRALAPLLTLPKLPLVTTPVTGHWIRDHLRAVIERHHQALRLAVSDQARSDLRAELGKALLQPAHDIREKAIDRIAEQRRLQGVLQELPSWLATASQAERSHYAGLLDDYHRLAAGQEQFLQGQPVVIQAFAVDLLKARLKADLGQDINPEQVLLRLPDSVEVKAVANVPSQVQVPSAARATLSLVELALLGIDRQMTLRLGYARIIHHDAHTAVGIPGLSVSYLRKQVLELDVARRYREKIQTLFRVQTGASTPVALRAQIMALPYSAAFRLQAFGAWRQGWVNKQQWQLLEEAATLRAFDPAQSIVDVQLSAVTLSLGPGEHDLPSGLLLIQAPVRELYCLYLPDVPQGANFIQAPTLHGLRASLLTRLRTAPMRRWLARQTGIGRATAERERYIEQAYQRNYTSFIKFTELGDPVWPLASKLLGDHGLKLLDDASLVARSRDDIKAAFARQLRDGGKQLLLSGLAYLPGIGTVLQLSDGWRDADQALTAFAHGDPALGLRRLASAELNFGFALVSFVPGMAAAKLARSSLRQRQDSRRVLAAAGRDGARVDGFAGHEVAVDLVRATPQRGPDAGTWKLGGKLYLWQDGHAYEVFRRRGEFTLRLRRTASNSYEHPVRLGADGRFATHLDTGLRAGGRSRTGSTSRADTSAMANYLIAPEDRSIMVEVLTRGGRYNLDETASSLATMPGDQARKRFFAKRRQLLRDADGYLQRTSLAPRVDLPVLANDTPPAALITGVFERAGGLVVGEAHSSAASKRFLIDNFATFRAAGVKTLYFEHLPLDFLADDLATLNASGVMTPALRARLKQLDTGHRVDPGQPFTFEEVVRKANAAGLEVVSLDCAASWYAKGVMDPGTRARQRMFSYLATQVIEAHQQATGEHKWVALVGNSHSNTFDGIPGLAELNKAVGVRVVSPPAGNAPSLRPDPGLHTAFNEGTVKADLLLEVKVPAGHHGTVASAAVFTPEQQAALAEIETILTVRPVALQPARPRLTHPGAFYIEKVGGKRQVVHLSRDGNVYHTPIVKEHGRYSLSRPGWDRVHGRRFWTLQGLLAAMAEQSLTHVPG